MNFLNEVVLDFPRAISFAPGRPAEQFCQVEEGMAEMPRFVAERARLTGWTEEAVLKDLGQYNKTNGILQDIIRRQLEVDEGIRVPARSIVVTAGCQEAMLLLLMALFEPEKDVLLSTDPTYIGITGLADIFGIRVEPISCGADGLEPEAFRVAVRRVRESGLRPVALYDVPDFNNPLGTSLPLAARHEVLAIARQEKLLVFEDNPYGMFAFDGEPLPTLKSLDTDGTVIYLGTFSKTLYPGLRVGYLVADQPVQRGSGEALLADELSKVKSLTTVTTSPLVQAMIGGLLLKHGGSLKPLVAEKIPFYRRNRDTLVACLEEELGAIAGVSWNRPRGGFFLTLELPFDFDTACLETCARDYGVICCPMTFFARAGGAERQVRFSFSYVTPEQIREGVARFARFVRHRLELGEAP
ncbi:MAG: PLP-dependent aminotransferase family protein [Acidobacteria bacterium]|nr:PLP-dependent aminotransferase family protein [Acidobacteriota bacterium]